MKIKPPLQWFWESRLRRRVVVITTMAVLAGLAQSIMAGVAGVLVVALIAGLCEVVVHRVDREDEHA